MGEEFSHRLHNGYLLEDSLYNYISDSVVKYFSLLKHVLKLYLVILGRPSSIYHTYIQVKFS